MRYLALVFSFLFLVSCSSYKNVPYNDGVYYNQVDSEENLVRMSAREHFLAHQLLYKIHKTNELLYAVIMMTVHDSRNRSMNRRYEWMRRKFSEEHPCKRQDVKKKISDTLKSYYESEEYMKKSEERFWKYREIRECMCGCGTFFLVYKKDKKRYFDNTHSPKPDYKKVSETLRKTLSSLDDDEMKKRMKKSFGSGNNTERIKNISKSKKGKKTNQQYIMGIKYAAMNDDEFEIFLKSRSSRVHNRMIKLRNKFLCRNLK
jgi:hypothetical protein